MTGAGEGTRGSDNADFQGTRVKTRGATTRPSRRYRAALRSQRAHGEAYYALANFKVYI